MLVTVLAVIGGIVVVVVTTFVVWVTVAVLWEKVETHIRYISECAVKRMVKVECLANQFRDDLKDE